MDYACFSFSTILKLFNVEWLNSIYEDFKFIAIRNTIIQLLSALSILLFVKTENDFVIYALILSLATSCNCFVNYFHVRKTHTISLTRHPNIRKHMGFILILFFNALAVSFYVNSDVTILGILDSDSTVGVYSVSIKYTM